MKKYLIAGTSIILLFTALVPFLISAQEGAPLICCQLNRDVTVDGVTYTKNTILVSPGEVSNCKLSGGRIEQNKKWALICLISSIKVATDWIFSFLMAFVSLMVIMGAYTIASAGGSPDKVNKGKNYILYGMAG